MRDPRAFAALSSSLLARKGTARPAMRPQMSGAHRHISAGALTPLEEQSLQDLGWNDMGGAGHGGDARQMRSNAGGDVAHGAIDRNVEPVVVVMPGCESISALDAPRRVVENDQLSRSAKGRAAFTLRLDAERHLRLRLASAVTNRSAQNLVVEALDQYLARMGDLETLADALGKRH